MTEKTQDPVSPPSSESKKEPYFYCTAPTALVKSKFISDAAVRLYLLYHSYCPKKHIEKGYSRTYVSQGTLAEELGCSTKKVQRLQKELEGTGWIAVKSRKGVSSNIITLHSKTDSVAELKRKNKRVLEKLASSRLQKRLAFSEVDATNVSGGGATRMSQ